MSKRDPRIDEYIARSATFAKPILKHIRKLVHAGCPAVQETMKWSFPHFDHRGVLCSMAAFKNHCTFGFWKSELIFGTEADTAQREETAMGQFGRITALADLPKDEVLLGYIRNAAELNETGITRPIAAKPRTKKVLVVPDYFRAALKNNAKALMAFEKFSYSHKKEYVEWLTEAKRDETRLKRLATTLQWLAKGKSRNWKYENC